MFTRQAVELVSAASCGVTILLEAPSTQGNFRDYNRLCDSLDADRLMQPINEADYDSETQVCVDRATGGPSSFYDHFVRRPRKKKGLRIGCECPASFAAASCVAAPDDNHLTAPAQVDLPMGAVSCRLLRDPVARRLATGRLPSPQPQDNDRNQDGLTDHLNPTPP